ncbi:MAG TPA: hypothetical protein VM536_13145, partial [Chloroflexia bacterium]|nr:hypothetical protein [Chloroflexia bacterium]
MASTQSTGKCGFCQKVFSKGGMTKHLETCPQAPGAPPPARGRRPRALHVIVEGRDAPMYWMHLEVPRDATLGE